MFSLCFLAEISSLCPQSHLRCCQWSGGELFSGGLKTDPIRKQTARMRVNNETSSHGGGTEVRPGETITALKCTSSVAACFQLLLSWSMLGNQVQSHRWGIQRTDHHHSVRRLLSEWIHERFDLKYQKTVTNAQSFNSQQKYRDYSCRRRSSFEKQEVTRLFLNCWFINYSNCCCLIFCLSSTFYIWKFCFWSSFWYFQTRYLKMWLDSLFSIFQAAEENHRK